MNIINKPNELMNLGPLIITQKNKTDDFFDFSSYNTNSNNSLNYFQNNNTFIFDENDCNLNEPTLKPFYFYKIQYYSGNDINSRKLILIVEI